MHNCLFNIILAYPIRVTTYVIPKVNKSDNIGADIRSGNTLIEVSKTKWRDLSNILLLPQASVVVDYNPWGPTTCFNLIMRIRWILSRDSC